MTKFKVDVKVRFAHCDPAGIIFYPRYFEILNGVIEDWFDQAIGCSFGEFLEVRGLGVPMVDVRSEFLAPCFLDDLLMMELILTAIGTASANVSVYGYVKDKLKIKSKGVLVCSKRDLSGSNPWPEDVLERMKLYHETL